MHVLQGRRTGMKDSEFGKPLEKEGVCWVLVFTVSAGYLYKVMRTWYPHYNSRSFQRPHSDKRLVLLHFYTSDTAKRSFFITQYFHFYFEKVIPPLILKGDGDDTAANFIKFKCRDFDDDRDKSELAHPPGHGLFGGYGG